MTKKLELALHLLNGATMPAANFRGPIRVVRRDEAEAILRTMAEYTQVPLYYEAHIAMEPAFRALAERLGPPEGWWVSAIVGDDLLGADKKVYLTRRGESAESLIALTKRMTDLLGSVWLRRKVEVALFDELNPKEGVC